MRSRSKGSLRTVALELEMENSETTVSVRLPSLLRRVEGLRESGWRPFLDKVDLDCVELTEFGDVG